MTPRSAPRRSGPGTSRPAQRSGPPHRKPREFDGVGGDQVEGRHAVLELLRAKKRTVKKIFIADGQDASDTLDAIEFEAQRQRVAVTVVSMARLDREATTEGHQGVMALASPLKTVSLDELAAAPRAFLLVCDGVTDPRNLGAMLRSADGAGVTGVILPRHRSARVSPSVTKTAAGAIEYLTFCDVGGIPTAIDQLNKAGVLTIGLAGESSASLYDLDVSVGAVALVVGGEENGLSALTRKRCSAVVAIPQKGRINSLNAGVALSVAAFEVSRQQRAR